MPQYLDPNLRWSRVSVSHIGACGIVKGGRLKCWGIHKLHLSRKKPFGEHQRFSELALGQNTLCAIEKKSKKLFCTGTQGTREYKKCPYYQVDENWKGAVKKRAGLDPDKVRWRSVAVSRLHTCGFIEGSNKPICWGCNGEYQVAVPTKGIQWSLEASCRIQHPELNGPASCTMCHPGCHHTIIDPKRNAGTCTKAECPMCKPKECCGKAHKHYVYNTESMHGVCVRHNDDCTAVCVPREPSDSKKSVCSKGCNKMVKVPKEATTPRTKGTALTEKQIFDIVVCQVDHRIECMPWRKGSGELQSSGCKTKKWVKPVARCSGFDADVWNAGPTCIANHADHDPHPQCPEKVAKQPDLIEKVKNCTAAVEGDSAACGVFATALAEYY